MKNIPSTRLFGPIKTKEKNMRFMEPRTGMGDLPSPVNKKVTPMVELIQHKECDIHYKFF
jgi:hypothetical protein